MPTLFNPNRRKGVFMIPSGATKSPTPAPPSFSNTKSLDFDGVDDRLSVAYNSSLNVVTGNHSLSFWLKTTDGSTQIVTEKGSGDELAAWIASNKIRWAGANTLNSSTSVNDGNWKHIVFVADGSTSYIYVNGSLDATGGNKIQGSANASEFSIGSRANNSFNFLGNLDSLAVFNYALTSANVTTIYNSGVVNNLNDLTTVPITWLRMGDGSTFPTINDDGSASNSGTMTNMTSGDIVEDVPS